MFRRAYHAKMCRATRRTSPGPAPALVTTPRTGPSSQRLAPPAAPPQDAVMTRCEWCGNNPLYVSYHDEEWGVPVWEDRRLFEMLTLEGAQAGLSWLTILKKRAAYRVAFEGFQPARVARYGPRDINRLLGNPGLVRNRRKIESAVKNARVVLAIQEQQGSLSEFLWRFVDGVPRQARRQRTTELPARTKESDSMSRELKRLGCNFVGSTICYAFMQAVGMVNDHVIHCFRHQAVRRLGRRPATA